MDKMKIGGLQKISLIDYPGLISAIVFLQGCNFKCPYCHNPELVEPKLFGPCLDEKEIFKFLKMRKGKLDAVTISGGEPTLQKELISFIRKIKKMGYAVKLDTNGSQPQVVAKLLAEKLLDFIAMDIKAPLDKYNNAVKSSVDQEKIKECINIILQSKIPYEFRTTIVKSMLTEKDILKIAGDIKSARRYVLQRFVPEKTLEKIFLQEKTYLEEELERIKKRLEKEIPSVIVR
jgi:pyruvate formate lyase activating enzyme